MVVTYPYYPSRTKFDGNFAELKTVVDGLLGGSPIAYYDGLTPPPATLTSPFSLVITGGADAFAAKFGAVGQIVILSVSKGSGASFAFGLHAGGVDFTATEDGSAAARPLLIVASGAGFANKILYLDGFALA